MSDIHNAAPGSDSAPAPIAPTPADTSPVNSVSQAARLLNAERRKQPQQPAPGAFNDAARAAMGGDEAPLQKLADEANAAQPQPADPGEATSEIEPAQQPPIEPPRSWTKEAKERWQSLPRETQDYLAQREQERDREVRRSQNETAEKLKGLTAKEQQVEQARQQYEAALPALLQHLNTQQQGEFADINTWADAQKLAAENPARFVQWQAHNEQRRAVAEEAGRVQQRQQAEYEEQWNAFRKTEDSKFLEKFPEYSDPTEAKKILGLVQKTLTSVGIDHEDFLKAYNGKASFSPRQAPWQEIIIKAALYDEAKSVAAKPVPKSVPPVQRPGVSKPAGAQDDAQIQALTQKLERTGSLRDAQALRAAQVRSRRA